MSTRGDILKYAVLPGILPRLLALFRSGFVHIAYMMAVIYANVRLLPPDHPYLMPQNIGRYGLRHVIAQAANNLTFTRKNIDQTVIFFTILGGLVLLMMQFVLLVVAIMAEQPAYALSTSDLFANPGALTGSLGPAQDIAFIILDRVFGVKGFFDSCISQLIACEDMRGQPVYTAQAFPFPFHTALHKMLQFYSYGIFMVGVFVIIYFAMTIIAETAQTGTPFGQRFNRAWAPVRFILFFALIIPIQTNQTVNQGLNGAQLITFQIVKMGSNMATNAWAYFNKAPFVAAQGPNGETAPTAGLSASYLAQQKDLVAKPNVPQAEVIDLMKSIYFARACQSAYANAPGDTSAKDIQAYLIRPPLPSGVSATVNGPEALTPNALLMSGTDYENAVFFSSRGDVTGNVIIRFGQLGQDDPDTQGQQLDSEYASYMGNVKPYCGDITIQLQGLLEPGANTVFEAYYDQIVAMWNDGDFKGQAACLAQKYISGDHNPNCTAVPTKSWAEGEIQTYTNAFQTALQNGITDQRSDADFNLENNVIKRGWAGASIWYNRIAAMNGAVTSAVLNVPKMSKLPLLMEVAARSNMQEKQYISIDNIFRQDMKELKKVEVKKEITKEDREMLTVMVKAHDFWVKEAGAVQSASFDQSTGNVIIDFLNVMLGTSGLFEMRANTDVHPLAQLSSLGKGMMEATLRNAGGALVLWGVSAGLEDKSPSKAMVGSLQEFLFTFVLVAVGIASILYYVLPFLPFIYFMFAVSGWVKSIFEAIVAMPLWALAHLRIDGEGMVGPAATNGYFLLMEIFLRPVLIVFGFIASISIFAALVDVLNQIFDLVIANTGGYNHELEAEIASGTVSGMISKMNFGRGPLDEFFFTAIYAIICYLIGLACFKLVDLIPNNIMRWMGVSVSTFQENAGDPAGQLTGNVYKGSLLIGNQIKGKMGGDFAVIAAG